MPKFRTWCRVECIWACDLPELRCCTESRVALLSEDERATGVVLTPLSSGNQGRQNGHTSAVGRGREGECGRRRRRGGGETPLETVSFFSFSRLFWEQEIGCPTLAAGHRMALLTIAHPIIQKPCNFFTAEVVYRSENRNLHWQNF